MKKRKKGAGAKRDTRGTAARSAAPPKARAAAPRSSAPPTARAAALRSARAAAPARARRVKRARGQTDVFALAPECTISDIAPLQAGLTGLLEHPSSVTLDIEAVQRIDTAAMQMVVAFVRERETQGRQVQWRGNTSVFGSAARLLGLAPMLHLPDCSDERS